MADPYWFKGFHGIVPWQFRPSYYSTAVENPRRAMICGSITELLLMVGGALLVVGLVLGLVNFDNSVINIIGYVLLGVGGVLFFSGIIICGAVLKHVCFCRCGKPTLADMKKRADEARKQGKPFPLSIKTTNEEVEASQPENSEPLVDKPQEAVKDELGQQQSQAEEGRI